MTVSVTVSVNVHLTAGCNYDCIFGWWVDWGGEAVSGV